MKIYAYHPIGNKDEFIEIEVSALPGLPKFTIIGLPDSSLKEGVLRIKSALMTHGFDWPKNQEVIINLKPSGQKKLNKAIEFAITVAFLLQSQQVQFDFLSDDKKILVLGDVDLFGGISLSSEFHKKVFSHWQHLIIAGQSSADYLFDHYRVSKLSDLKFLKEHYTEKQNYEDVLVRPEIHNLMWSEKEAQFIKLLAIGEHSALVAGPQGSGKTTLAKQIWALKEIPSLEEFEEIQSHSLSPQKWVPLVQPHHSIPKISLIGGGVPPRQGEITRAHQGIMILDEFLEFKRESIEVLREALQDDEVEISRLGTTTKFKSNFQAIATTNLCPCGKWDGGKYNLNCNRSLKSCKSYLNRLVGPVVDRFDILWLKGYLFEEKNKVISSEDIFKDIQNIRSFRKNEGRLLKNSKLSFEDILKKNSHPLLENAYEFRSSIRRKEAFWRVALSLSEIRCAERIDKKDLKEAYFWTNKGFHGLM